MNTRVAWNGETGFRRSSWACDSSSSSCSRIQWQCFPIQQRSMMINGNKSNNLGNQNQTFFSIRSYHFPGFFLCNHVIQTKAQQKAMDTSGRGMDPSRDSQAGFIPVQFSASSSSNSRTKDSSWYENHHKWSLSLFHLDEMNRNSTGIQLDCQIVGLFPPYILVGKKKKPTFSGTPEGLESPVIFCPYFCCWLQSNLAMEDS